MDNSNGQKGIQLTEEGQKIFSNNRRSRETRKRMKDKDKTALNSKRNSFPQEQEASNTSKYSNNITNQISQAEEVPLHFERSFKNELNSLDEQLAREIQRAIETDLVLFAVHNKIQIMVENGIVTLEGKVNTNQERIVAGERAIAIAGYGKVNNYLSLANS